MTMEPLKFVFFCVIGIFLQCTKVRPTGRLVLQLLSYNNSLGVAQSGHCCDGDADSADTCWKDQCDPYFIICVNEIKGQHIETEECSLGQFRTRTIWNQNIVHQFIDAVAEFPFKDINRKIKITIDVLDDDTSDRDVLIERYDETVHLPRGRHDNSLPLVFATRTQLNTELWVLCDPDWYGESCSVFCQTPDVSTSYNCGPDGQRQCHPGWIGTFCNISTPPVCTQSPCDYREECFYSHEQYRCTCYNDCSRVIQAAAPQMSEDLCSPNPCSNGGHCSQLGGVYSCLCDMRYTGSHCEDIVNLCASSPCYHGAMCRNYGAWYECVCPDGFTGVHCETELDPCANAPCLYGSQCTPVTYWEYKCTCVPGQTGRNCEVNVKECLSGPCLNGGLCVDGRNSYFCKCLSGTKGTHCEKVTGHQQTPPPPNAADRLLVIATYDWNIWIPMLFSLIM